MEGYTSTGMVFAAQEPYPPVQAERPNHRYAEAMLDNVGGSNSEMSAVGLYFYGHLAALEVPEAAEIFHRISLVEMHHLEIFATLARQMGEDPRLWGVQQGRKRWWTPEYLQYQRRLGPMIRIAVREEKASIRKYRAQARWIGDRNIVENLRRIIQDEEQHLVVLGQLYETCVGTEEAAVRSGPRHGGT